MWFEESKPKKKTRKKTTRKKTTRRNTRGGRKPQKSSLLNVRSSRKKTKGVHPSGRKTAAVVLFLAVLGGLIWMMVSGTRLLARTVYAANPTFEIIDVQVNNPGGRLKDTHIREYAGLEDGMNIFEVSLEEIHQNLESAPLVKDVVVTRALPGTLIIDVKERSPIVRLGRDARGYHLSADVDGYVLGPNKQTPFLPSITGVLRKGLRPGDYIEDPGFRDALELVDMCQSAGLDNLIKFETIDIGHPDHLDTRLEGGARVLFSRHDKEEKLYKLRDIIYKAQSKRKKLEMANMTVSKNFPVTLR